MLTPYLLYLKISAAVLIVAMIGGLNWWIRSAFEERDKLRISDATKTALVDQYQKSMARDSQVREGINEAISKIRVTSNVNVQRIESDPPPTAPDGTPIELFAGGMPTRHSLSTFSNATSNSGTSIPPAN